MDQIEIATDKQDEGYQFIRQSHKGKYSYRQSDAKGIEKGDEARRTTIGKHAEYNAEKRGVTSFIA